MKIATKQFAKKSGAIAGKQPQRQAAQLSSADGLKSKGKIIRILTAVPICDGHDSAINTVNLEFIHNGIEVIYLGYHRPVRDIVRAAIQEDVQAVGLSSYNGGHVEVFSQVVAGLRAQGADDIGVFGGGGGTITEADAKEMIANGVDRIFFAGTPLGALVDYVHEHYTPGARGNSSAGRRLPVGKSSGDRRLARALTEAENNRLARSNSSNGHLPKEGARNDAGGNARHGGASSGNRPLVIGITGPGGAGKTTLIDELVLRSLQAMPGGRVAVLSHDPSIVGKGALLGDRAAMIYSQDDRVFMRSMATRGQPGGVSAGTHRCLRLLTSSEAADLSGADFDIIFVETVGIGQEAMPFRQGLVDKTVLVMSPDYGSRLQLQKIVMLDLADVVVVNKSDLVGAKTAAQEVGHRIGSDRPNARQNQLVSTVAKRHRDAGVDRLFHLLTDGRFENERR